MIYLMAALIFAIIVLANEYRKLYIKNMINYSNYQNCLIVLKRYDRDLVDYLERGEINDKKNR